MANAIEQENMTTVHPTFGRYSEIPLDEMTPDQRSGYDAIIRDRGMNPGPYKIWVEDAPVMKLMVPFGVYYRSGSHLSEAEREIAVVLTVAKWGAAFPISEHEWIAESTGGYPKLPFQPKKWNG